MTTLPLTLTYDQAKADLLKIADENPDRSIRDMNGTCMYFMPSDSQFPEDYGDLKPGESCCIVGRVLEMHDVTYEDVRDENEGANVADLATNGVLEVDDRTRMLLLTAQAQQDGGHTWREAVDTAVEAVESL